MCSHSSTMSHGRLPPNFPRDALGTTKAVFGLLWRELDPGETTQDHRSAARSAQGLVALGGGTMTPTASEAVATGDASCSAMSSFPPTARLFRPSPYNPPSPSPATRGAKATVLTVVEPFHAFTLSPDQIEATRADYERARARIKAGEYLAAAEHEARQLGVPCDVIQLQGDDPISPSSRPPPPAAATSSPWPRTAGAASPALVLGNVTQKVLTHLEAAGSRLSVSAARKDRAMWKQRGETEQAAGIAPERPVLVH